MKTRALILAVALAGVGIFCGVWVVMWLTRGSYVTALIILCLAIWALGFAWYILLSTSGLARPRKRCGADGTLLRPPKIVDMIFGASAAAIVTAAVLYGVFAPFGIVDYVPTGVMRMAVPAGCIAILVFGVPTLFRMIKHGGTGHLRLTPEGFEVWNGQFGSFVRGEWEAVDQVLDRPPRGSSPYHDVIVFVQPKRRSAVLVADAITGNTRGLLEWVRFYWQHPQCRDELVDERGLRRLDAGPPR
ncbi:hypothetical protein ACAG25_12600 [Mycobacterium sp. pV006]|uniref:hypothetical protein n=1 Tax=Mycobacterium sp. pV006 TaxID=3238983 RepID=UPI00351B46C4